MLQELFESVVKPLGDSIDERIAALMSDADDEKRMLGFLLKAAVARQRTGAAAAITELQQVRHHFNCMPLPVIVNLIDLCRQSGREQEAADACLVFAHDAAAMGYADLALEAASAAIVLDAQGVFDILKTPARSLELAMLYERIALTLNPHPGALPAQGPPWHVALVVSNLVDHVVAHTKTVLHFARYANREQFRLVVVSSENMAGRRNPLFPFGSKEYPSEQAGAVTIAELRRLNVPVILLQRDATFTQAARLLCDALSDGGTHIALFQSGLASPIDWLAARLARVPVKAAIHIGSSLFNNGLHATFYDNPVNIEREQPVWPDSAGVRIYQPLGVDIAELDRQKPMARSCFGLPADAVVIGTLSNHLDKRLSEPFLDLIANVLVSYPNAWFVAFGPGALSHKLAVFKERSVAERVIFAGAQRASGSALKLLDIYASEFPVGGCVSVLEAMACGVPVVAMRAGDAHAESAAAEAVGLPYAILTPEPSAYASLLTHWLENSEARCKAGMHMRAVALQKHHVRDYVAKILGHCSAL